MVVFSRLFKKGVLMAAVASMSACSLFKVGYNNAPTLAHTWLITRIDLYDDQSALARRNLDAFFVWHREHELPQFRQRLLALADRSGQLSTASAKEVEEVSDAFRQSLARSAEKASVLLAPAMLSLWPNQIEPLQRLLDSSNEDYREENLEISIEEKREKLRDTMNSRFETWLGPLSEEQAELIDRWADQRPDYSEARYESRIAQQKKYMALVEKAANRQLTEKKLATELERLLNGWQAPKSKVERQQTQERRELVLELVVAVLGVSTPEQTEHFRQQARDWAFDLGELIEQS